MSEVFDRFAKWTARGSSRRDVLRYLGGILGGGFLMGAFSGCKQLQTISAECQAYCAACNGVSGAYGNCLSVCEACALVGGTLCPGPIGTPLSTCTSSTVVACCLGAAQCCTQTGTPYCANFSFDPQNCNGCGNACTSGTKPGCCGGNCVDLSSDANHCGRCRKVCSGTNPACCSGTCADLNSDVNNCGACGSACTGQTTPGCCSGACTDLATDNSNCGSCGTVCGSGTTCTNGTCM